MSTDTAQKPSPRPTMLSTLILIFMGEDQTSRRFDVCALYAGVSMALVKGEIYVSL